MERPNLEAFFSGLLGVFAEFETNLRRERQIEGIAAAKAARGLQRQGPEAHRECCRSLQAARDGKAGTGGHRQSPWDRPRQRLSGARQAGCRRSDDRCRVIPVFSSHLEARDPEWNRCRSD